MVSDEGVTTPTRDVLTAPEAAERKGVHRNSVLKAIRNGHLQARKSGRAWLIDRRSLERWEPKGGQAGRSHPGLQAETLASESQVDETNRRKRAQQLVCRLDEWMADESGHDEETWPKLKAILEQDRISFRPLFRETTP
jgi:excisionase family DNA binding protein